LDSVASHIWNQDTFDTKVPTAGDVTNTRWTVHDVVVTRRPAVPVSRQVANVPPVTVVVVPVPTDAEVKPPVAHRTETEVTDRGSLGLGTHG